MLERRIFAPADHATVAAFWHRRLAQLKFVCISRVASGAAAR
jgi:hypothetical protein